MFSYFIDLQGSQTLIALNWFQLMFSYFIDLQGSQTLNKLGHRTVSFSYFIDLQGSQTRQYFRRSNVRLVTLLIYKVLKHILL